MADYIFAMNSKRQLGYREYGDPNGAPLIYCHGTPSCRLEGALVDKAAQRHGYRVIAVDRPGMGLSHYYQGRTITDWPQDVAALADHLKLSRFGLAGHSGGGPFILACAATLHARLDFVIGFCPFGPPSLGQDGASGLNAVDQFYAGLTRRWPWLMEVSFAPLGWCARHWPRFFNWVFKNGLGPADAQTFQDPDFRAQLRTLICEAFREGAKGPAQDAMLAYQDWGFDLRDIQMPVHLWFGDQDGFVPLELANRLIQSIPQTHVHWMDGAGHFNYAAWDEVLAAI